ncbi:2-amino-4-hydroxy-6-hydroxymethyldihydropteridine diphosphokinase [Paenibacillus sp. MBLB4367]|uniref:2-amino-4-hydroxy-6- hydroxymethyldihydropteridine diphosphokinase n=1 Tax=Paenibacillus sp. MBLB4367 TaxID=3384767 RepID=UPI0039082DF7
MSVDGNSGVLAFIGLGSNLGDRERYLLDAVRMLDEHPHIRVVRQSFLYETDPVGYVDQPAFLNAVAAVQTELPAGELLGVMQNIERELGRTRDIRFGPRTVDLDLLLFGNETRTEPELILPHPRMLERAFVLVPLLDVLEGADVPGMEGPLSAYLNRLEGKEGVTRWKCS